MTAADLPVAALELIHRGYSILPCKPSTKVPATKNGVNDATKDAVIAKQWWDAAPARNIGVACGASGIAVFDIDSKAGADPDRVIPGLDLPENAVVIRTGKAPPKSKKHPNSLDGVRGAQVWFQGSIRTGPASIEGCEFRGEGSYVIAPPSIHPSKIAYEGDIPPVGDLPELPDHIRALADATVGGQGEPAPEVIQEGGRTVEMRKIAMSMRRGAAAASKEEIEAALLTANERRCEPPLPDEKIKEIARDVGTRIEPRTASPGNDRTHRTLAQNPHGNGPKGVRSPTEHPPNTGEHSVPDLALEPSILDRFDALMDRLGLVGERATARATYLVHISRLLDKPAREVVKGDSSTGKSFASECALAAAAPEETYVRTQTSPLALFYSEQDFRHRTIVFFEANKLGDDEDPLASVLRTLLSEGKLAYEVTDPRTHSTKYLEKEGPVAFITTTCKAKLDAEIETRILSLHSNGSDEQTKAVVRAIIEGADDTPPKPNLDGWHELDRWLRDGPRQVVIPWAKALASFEISGPPRLRRDIQNLLSLVKAQALLHRGTRDTDVRERIVATLDDYEAVSSLLAEAMAVATDRAVRQGTREVVEAVARLRGAERQAKTITMRAAQREAGRSSSTTHTDVHDALDRGYLVNRSESSNRFDLDLGDPLPKQEELLPSRDELEAKVEELFGGVRQVFGRRPNTQSRSQSQESPSVRSVRSNTDVRGNGASDPSVAATGNRAAIARLEKIRETRARWLKPEGAAREVRPDADEMMGELGYGDGDGG